MDREALELLAVKYRNYSTRKKRNPPKVQSHLRTIELIMHTVVLHRYNILLFSVKITTLLERVVAAFVSNYGLLPLPCLALCPSLPTFASTTFCWCVSQLAPIICTSRVTPLSLTLKSVRLECFLL